MNTKTVSKSSEQGLDTLFTPRAIALVGASDDPYKIGGRPLRYMTEASATIPIYPVNPTKAEVQGIRAYPSIQDIPAQIDQAILAVPAARIHAAVEDGLAAGVRTFVMFSAGFAEAGEKGAEQQKELVELIQRNGARLLGPNAIGFFDTRKGVYSTFSSAMDRGIPAPGKVSVVSQSGAVGSYIQNLLISRGVRLSKFVATGNEADIDSASCIEWMAKDPDTEIIVVYLESARNGERLKSALMVAKRMRKPVIMFKAGRTDAGQTVAASHTGAMAGSAAVFNAVMKACSVIQATTLPELVDLTYSLQEQIVPASNKLSVITISGGVGVIAADAATELGLELPPMPKDILQQINETLPLAVGLNPLDTTAATIGDRSMLAKAIESMLDSRSYDFAMIFVGNAGLSMRDTKAICNGISTIRTKYPQTLIAICTQSQPDTARLFEEAGYLVFEDPESCLRTFAKIQEYSAQLEQPVVSPEVSMSTPPALPQRIDEVDAIDLLSNHGVQFAQTKTANNEEQAIEYSNEIGFPVVLKIRSPDIAHKSDIGGVKINLQNSGEVAEAYHTIMSNVQNHAPKAEILGISVNQMILGGVQMIVGTHYDHTFGTMVMVGLGGIFTEILKDTVMCPAPVSHTQAMDMVKSLKGFSMLDGARGTSRADIHSLASVLVSVSEFAYKYGSSLDSVEINPLIISGEGAFGVDALIIPRKN